MRVFYRSVRRSFRSNLPTMYEHDPAKWCCAEMCRWWNVLIGFGVRNCPASTNRGVNLFLDRPQANGKTILEVVPVQHCPWCGEAIEACRVK